jgi:hypothetical protein
MPGLRTKAKTTPLILSFSRQARQGELATWSVRIRKPMRMEKGRLNSAQCVQQRSLSQWERDRVRGATLGGGS